MGKPSDDRRALVQPKGWAAPAGGRCRSAWLLVAAAAPPYAAGSSAARSPGW
ncbi:MAG TPA: hypothetical protein VH589_24110 [Trebonia sp.]